MHKYVCSDVHQESNVMKLVKEQTIEAGKVARWNATTKEGTLRSKRRPKLDANTDKSDIARYTGIWIKK